MSRNVVFVEQGAHHPALYSPGLMATQLSWIEERPPTFPFACTAKIRYRQTDQPCSVRLLEEGGVQVLFSSPQRAVTPGQSIVFYQGDICLGGGIIQRPTALN